MLRTATMLAVVCVSCADRVDVGSAGKAIDLGACLGEDAACGAGDVLRFTADLWSDQAVSQCETSEDDAWHLDWWLPLDAVPCAPLGFCSPWATAVTGDGSIWLAGVGMTSIVGNDQVALGGVFVAHYDSQGKLIAKRVLETAQLDRMMPDVQAAIAARDGTGAIVVARLDGETWVQRLDAQLSSGPRVALTGVDEVGAVNLSLHPSGGVYLSAGGSLFGEQGPTALALLDAELEPVWVQGSTLHSARLLHSDSDGLTLLGMTQSADGTLGRDLLVSYDAHGNAIRELDVGGGLELISVRADGELSLLSQSAGSPFPYYAIEITSEGEMLEEVEIADMSLGPDSPLEERFALVSATADREGNSYFAHHSPTKNSSQGIAIVERHADGKRCTKSIVEFGKADLLSTVEVPQSQLWRSDDGALYVRFDRGMVRLSR
ncbi:MAG TPA: hypothetical protein VJR89_22425 [Polyangiales bacterium]|nr:hypothetical protein [Polyangiales bacterium]